MGSRFPCNLARLVARPIIDNNDRKLWVSEPNPRKNLTQISSLVEDGNNNQRSQPMPFFPRPKASPSYLEDIEINFTVDYARYAL